MRAFWKAAGIRALRTGVQSLVASAPVAAIAAGGFDWQAIGLAAATAGGAAVLSLLNSVASGLPEVDESPGRHAAPDDPEGGAPIG